MSGHSVKAREKPYDREAGGGTLGEAGTTAAPPKQGREGASSPAISDGSDAGSYASESTAPVGDPVFDIAVDGARNLWGKSGGAA